MTLPTRSPSDPTASIDLLPPSGALPGAARGLRATLRLAARLQRLAWWGTIALSASALGVAAVCADGEPAPLLLATR